MPLRHATTLMFRFPNPNLHPDRQLDEGVAPSEPNANMVSPLGVLGVSPVCGCEWKGTVGRWMAELKG